MTCLQGLKVVSKQSVWMIVGLSPQNRYLGMEDITLQVLNDMYLPIHAQIPGFDIQFHSILWIITFAYPTIVLAQNILEKSLTKWMFINRYTVYWRKCIVPWELVCKIFQLPLVFVPSHFEGECKHVWKRNTSHNCVIICMNPNVLFCVYASFQLNSLCQSLSIILESRLQSIKNIHWCLKGPH